MSRLEPYVEYRNVNLRWLRTLPIEWGVSRVRYVCDVTTGSGDRIDSDVDGGYPFYVRSPNPLASSGYSFDTEAVLTAGDGAVGEVFHHVSGKFHAHQRVYVLHGFRGVHPRFFFYYFSALFRLMCSDGAARTTVDSVRRWMVTDMPMPVPPLDEQRAIADYLDVQTSRIDTLIAKQNQLIDTLRERRGAAVTHATEGKAPNTVLRRHVNGIRQGWSPNCYLEPADGVNEWGVLKTGCSNGGVFRPQENKLLPDGVDRRADFAVRDGDIVMSRASTRGFVGAPAVVRGYFPKLILSDLNYGLSTRNSLDADYAVYALTGRRARAEIEGRAKGSSPSMQKLSQGDVLELPIWLPPLAEQREIAEYLDTQSAKIDALIAKTQEHIALAKERRAALITAAVTGQFDVRTAVQKVGA